jgi:PAS domain S-box-containing protein
MTLPPDVSGTDDRSLEVLKSIHLEGLIQAIPDIAYIKDADRRNLIVNRAFESAFGLSQADVMGKRDEEILPPGLAAACKASDETALSGGGAIRFEEEAAGPDGRVLFYDTTKAPILSTDGRIIGLIGISRDITAQKENERALGSALDEKDVLLKEIHHRVKNNLQVISSLLSLQSRCLRHPEDAVLFQESQRRIRSMALVHERLYQSKSLSRIEFAAYAKRLVESLIASHHEGGRPVALEADLEEVFLDIQTAIPCGLIVNELIMNALKHAFPDGRPGTIRLGLRLEADGRVELKVGDDGVGLPPGWDIESAGSMGMQIVTMLTGQIEGRLEISRAAGTQFRLSFKEIQYKQRL